LGTEFTRTLGQLTITWKGGEGGDGGWRIGCWMMSKKVISFEDDD